MDEPRMARQFHLRFHSRSLSKLNIFMPKQYIFVVPRNLENTATLLCTTQTFTVLGDCHLLSKPEPRTLTGSVFDYVKKRKNSEAFHFLTEAFLIRCARQTMLCTPRGLRRAPLGSTGKRRAHCAGVQLKATSIRERNGQGRARTGTSRSVPGSEL